MFFHISSYFLKKRLILIYFRELGFQVNHSELHIGSFEGKKLSSLHVKPKQINISNSALSHKFPNRYSFHFGFSLIVFFNRKFSTLPE